MKNQKSLKRLMRKSVDLVFLSIATPFMVGVYEDLKLIDAIKSDKKSSDALTLIYAELEKKYDIKRLVYVNGPGSFMAIKLTYIFLKSISVIKDTPLYAMDAFYFNNNQPIKAIAKLYFVKISSKIETIKLDDTVVCEFSFSPSLNESYFNNDNAPMYAIGAIG